MFPGNFPPVLLIQYKGVTAVTHSRKSAAICFLNLTKQSGPHVQNQRLLQITYFIVLKKLLENIVFVVDCVLPVMVGNVRKFMFCFSVLFLKFLPSQFSNMVSVRRTGLCQAGTRSQDLQCRLGVCQLRVPYSLFCSPF